MRQYRSRRISFAENLPWDIVDSGVAKALLEREALRAHAQDRAARHIDKISQNEAPIVESQMVTF